MTPETIAELRRLAELARDLPGGADWMHGEVADGTETVAEWMGKCSATPDALAAGRLRLVWSEGGGETKVIVQAIVGDTETAPIRAAFMANANPAAVLALLDAAERLAEVEAERDALAEEVADMVPRDWHGLMTILADVYPETVFPTLPDHEARDAGPRIVSLLRRVDALAAKVDAVRAKALSIRAGAERESALSEGDEEQIAYSAGEIQACLDILAALDGAETDHAELRRDAERWLMIGGERILPLLSALDVARAERDALAAKVERVREMHFENPFLSGACNECDAWIPCETVRALDGEDDR